MIVVELKAEQDNDWLYCKQETSAREQSNDELDGGSVAKK